VDKRVDTEWPANINLALHLLGVPLLVNTVMAQDYGYISVMMEALNGS
jgi:hypothetical protein